MTKPAVVLIGADKGGVGKTTVARTLLDYFAERRVRARASSLIEPHSTPLAKASPQHIELAAISQRGGPQHVSKRK